MNRLLLLPFLLVAALACTQVNSKDLKLIPYPASVELGSGAFKVAGADFAVDTLLGEPSVKAVEAFMTQLSSSTGKTSEFASDADVTFVYEPEFGSEEYSLDVTREGVVVKASSLNGVVYALETIRQLLPVEIYLGQKKSGASWTLPVVSIKDQPRFAYRGMHLDPSRHFFDLAETKRYIDVMVMHKMNTLHWHLTDDQGWRIEIRKYPKLTEVGGWRDKTIIGHLNSNQGYEYARYGGFYTQEEIREIVEYAASKGVTVIPEIDLPGHMLAALAAYPEYGCTGGPYEVWGRWGVSDDVLCVGKESTFKFIEDILLEVMELFPSEYIHIGGDEANKEHWKKCPKCQARMAEEGLQSVDELQSYMIKRIARYVESKGRKVIGWDEILDGGLAEGAAVMSWRGTEGGIKAMEMGHDVIMTPGRYCYLDHAQDAPFKEPESIGGYLPLDSVYVYEPIEPSMPQDKVGYLKGVQANLWTEYVVTDEHAEYMYWPRTIAIAETGWSQPEKKDLADFRRRVLLALDCLKNKGYATFDLASEYGERKLAQTGLEHKAKGCKVIYNRPIQDWYQAAGEKTFTDGVIGGWTYSDNRWQGFLSDIDVTVDLGNVQTVSYVGGTFMQLIGPGVFMPSKVDILVSEDGENFTLVATVWNDVPVTTPDLLFKDFSTICDCQARYVRYHAYRSTMRGFLFLDEVVVN